MPDDGRTAFGGAGDPTVGSSSEDVDKLPDKTFRKPAVADGAFGLLFSAYKTMRPIDFVGMCAAMCTG